MRGLAPFLAAVLAASAARAGGPGTTGAVSLKVPSGARPAGMGDAFVGLADDSNALFWNPAGLALVPAPQLSLMHTQYLVETSYQFASYAQPLSLPFMKGGMGVAVNTLSYGDLKLTGEDGSGLYGGITGAQAPREWFVSGGYGSGLPPLFGLDRIKGGVALKATFQPVSYGSLVGAGISAGALWDPPVNGLRVGTLVDNLGALTDGTKLLPINWRMGASYSASAGPVGFTGAADGQVSVDIGMRYDFGLEAVAYRVLALRAGWRGGEGATGPTFGVGVRDPGGFLPGRMRMSLDYAHSSYGDLGSADRGQVTVVFGGGGAGKAPVDEDGPPPDWRNRLTPVRNGKKKAVAAPFPGAPPANGTPAP
jgi:hypothetical protein